MARQIVVTLDGRSSSFDFSKLDRSKLYGQRRRIPLDPDGERCERAELASDGSILLRRGMTAQGYFDEQGQWVQPSELVGLSEDGQALQRYDSTLGAPQELVEATPEELLDHRVFASYMLDADEVDAGLQDALAEGRIFRFVFVYRPGYYTDTGFLVANDDGVFALIGRPTSPAYLELEQAAVDLFEEEVDEDDELDFEMF